MAPTSRKRIFFTRLWSRTKKPVVKESSSGGATSQHSPLKEHGTAVASSTPRPLSVHAAATPEESPLHANEVVAASGPASRDQSQPDPASEESRLELGPSNGPRYQNFWKEAFMSLPSEEQTLFASYQEDEAADVNAILAKIVKDVELKRAIAIEKKWTIRVGSSTHSLREGAERMLEWLERFKQVGDVAVNADPIHAGLPWAVFRLLLQTAVSDKEQLGCLILGLDRISHFIDRCGLYWDIYLEHPDTEMDKVRSILKGFLVDMYKRILQFLAKALKLVSKSTAGRAATAFWRPDDILSFDKDCDVLEGRVETALHDFDRRLEHKHRTDVSSQLSQSISYTKGLGEMRSTVSAILNRVEAVWQIQSGERAGKILTWVSTIANEDHHVVAREGRVEGTGEWIFGRETYSIWNNSKTSMILWLHGIPGAGKTKLISRVVDELLSTSSESERIAYFYCNQGDESRRKAMIVLGSFLKQLGCFQKSRIHKELVEAYEAREKLGFTSNSLSKDQIMSTLQIILRRIGRTTLILDALDECYVEERADIIHCCNELIEELPGLKIMISSRRNDDIKRQLEKKANLGIAAGDNNHDISIFVTQVLMLDQERRQLLGLNAIPGELVCQIVREITSKGGDMFQWAALQIGQLLKLERTSDIRNNLGKLPVSLKEAYDGIIYTIRSQAGSKPTVAIRAFAWLIAISTPVDIETLLAAVCQDPDDDELSEVDIDKDYILGACQNLVTINFTSDAGEHWAFTHLSVQEYFEDAGNQSVSLQASLQTVYEVSMTVLISVSEQPIPPSCEALYVFAAETWCEQVQTSAEWINSDEKALNRLIRFMGSPIAPSPAWVTWSEEAEHLEYPRLAQKAAFYACALGLSRLIQAWIDMHALNLNEEDEDGVPLLCYAIVWDQLEVVDVLLKHGADVNHDGRPLWAALMLAQKRGSFGVLEKLLDLGADVKQTVDKSFRISHDFRSYPYDFGPYKTLIEAACMPDWVPHRDYDAKRALSLLFAHGADCTMITTNDGFIRRPFESVLFGSVLGDRRPLIELMLRCGAEFQDPWEGSDETTALIEAIRLEDEYVFQFLIERGIDVNAHTSSGEQSNALLEAMVSGWRANIDVISILRKNGARADAGIPLAEAIKKMCFTGNLSHIETILETASANINDYSRLEHSGLNHSPLSAGVLFGSQDVVCLLIDRGANINQTIPTSHYGTALNAAILLGRYGMAELLLDKGSRLDVSKNGFPYPLAYAIERECFDIFRLLVTHDIGDFPAGSLGIDAAIANLMHLKELQMHELDDIDSVLHPLLHFATLHSEIDRWLEHSFMRIGPSRGVVEDEISYAAFDLE